MTMQYPALVLNADFRPVSVFPLSTLSWQDAIRAVVRGVVSVVAEYDKVVHSPTTTMHIPSVIALREYQKVDRHVAFTRYNVFLRDHFTCQYCGEKKSVKDLQFEHVVPRSKGGKTCWTNICAACDACNSTKADHTHMKPLRLPVKPTAWQLLAESQKYPTGYLHESWIDYMFWDTELQP